MSNKFYPSYPFGQLDAQAEAILDQIAESNGKPLTSQTPQQARECFLEKSWLGIPKENIRINNLNIENSHGQIPLRVYTPDLSNGNAERQVPFPILIFFHGGGFVLGTLDEFDPFCTFLANGASCIVVSVGYRLAPENKHPAAVEDAEAALKWIIKNAAQLNGDASRIAVAGDSAGANLAAVVSMIARDKGFPPILFQVLICPWLDLSSTESSSYNYFGDGLWLSTVNINWYRNHYLKNDEQGLSYFVSPLLAKNLKGVPPALIITAEFDVLRDEGEAYAARLKAEDIPVQCSRYNGMLHDFVILPGKFSKANDAISEICTMLKSVYNN